MWGMWQTDGQTAHNKAFLLVKYIMFEDMCRLGQWSFRSWFNENRSFFGDMHVLRKSEPHVTDRQMSGVQYLMQPSITGRAIKESIEVIEILLEQCIRGSFKTQAISLENQHYNTGWYILPQWFAFDADFSLAVLEEWWRCLLNDMLYTKTWLQVLIETLHEHQEMVAVTYVARYRL